MAQNVAIVLAAWSAATAGFRHSSHWVGSPLVPCETRAASRFERPPMKLSENAYRRFKEKLFSGDLRPGQFISQRELVHLIDVPLGPVREALQRLEVEGLVQIAPQRGIQIVEASLRYIRNTYQLRLIVEKEAAAKFAENATEAEIETLDNAHKAIIRRADSDGFSDEVLNEAQDVDWSLHDTLVTALGNDIITAIHVINNDRIRLIRLTHGKLTLLTPASFGSAMKEHLSVIEACARHDPAAAAEAMERHIATAMQRALGL